MESNLGEFIKTFEKQNYCLSNSICIHLLPEILSQVCKDIMHNCLHCNIICNIVNLETI